MQIVYMSQEHIPLLAELERQCFSHPWSERAFTTELGNPQAVFFVAEEEGKPVGYAGMYCVADEAYIANIAVSGDFRRRGIGAALLTALAETAEDRGCTFISLEVRVSNSAAISLYTAHGFSEEGRRKNFYSAPTEDGLIMTKRFAGK